MVQQLLTRSPIIWAESATLTPLMKSKESGRRLCTTLLQSANLDQVGDC